MVEQTDFVAAERQRVLAEYQRREREIDPDLYAAWQAAVLLMYSSRRRIACELLHHAGVFPAKGDRCLEVGHGVLGWLADLISWGVRETELHGIELDRNRSERTREILPMADLRVGDATALPWASNHFRLVVASTVFTSILEARVRRLIADEITRVLAPGGALLWYDFSVNNPSNPHVRAVTREEVRQLFPLLRGSIRSVTLAPPLARLVAPRSWVLATVLEAVPFLRTHLLAVLVKHA